MKQIFLRLLSFFLLKKIVKNTREKIIDPFLLIFWFYVIIKKICFDVI